MVRLGASLCVAACLVSACVAYRRAPPDLEEYARHANRDTVPVSAVREVLSRLAPDVAWDGKRFDRLTLLAAAIAINPRIAQARSAVERVATQAEAARSSPGPLLTLASEYSREADGSSPWLLGLASDIPLDVGGRRAGRLETADIALRIARIDYLQTLWSVRMDLRHALAERFQAECEIEVARELTGLRARQITVVERFVEVGESSRSELERVRADQATDTRRLIDAESRRSAAALALARALGVGAGALHPHSLTWRGFDEPQRLDPGKLDREREQAILGRSDVLAALAAYDQSENDLRMAVSAQYPAIRIGPGYTWERGIVKIPFSLALDVPSFDLNRGAIRVAEARRSEAARALEATVAAVGTSVAAAIDGYASAWSQLELAQRESLPTAVALAHRADVALTAGAIGRKDWLAAQAGERSARLDVIAAVGRVHAAEADLEDALRRPLEGPELAIVEPRRALEEQP